MIFRVVALALSLSLLSLGVAFADDAASTSSSPPKEIQELDPDRLARPVKPVSTADLAQQLGITDSVTIWFKFKINGKGEASKIEFVHNPASEEVATAAQKFMKDITFFSPSKRVRRKAHYYALTICPNCKRVMPPLDKSWEGLLREVGVNGGELVRDCADPINSVYPEMIHQVAPNYPRTARDNGDEGTVYVECLVDKTGTVLKVRVLKSSDSDLLDQASVDAAYQCLFKPGTCEGTRVAAIVTFKYDFDIH